MRHNKQATMLAQEILMQQSWRLKIYDAFASKIKGKIWIYLNYHVSLPTKNENDEL